jgi:phosphoribosylformimino-5-aminoimidazole carboxamide ribotide isomerase
VRIIPAIDLKDGKCVRLFKGDYEQTTEYSSDPPAIGRRFSSLHVSELHIVDLDGARSGSQANQDLIRDIVAETGLTAQLGGGIRQRQDVANWLDLGVARCVVGSMAIRESSLVKEWIVEFGDGSIVLALDIRLDDSGAPMLTTHGWTRNSGVSLWDCLDGYEDVGARHVLCTDVDRDGAMAGPNFELYTEILSRYPHLQLQASGGVRNIRDLQQLRDIGLPAAITGRALLDGKISEAEIRTFQQSA